MSTRNIKKQITFFKKKNNNEIFIFMNRLNINTHPWNWWKS